MKKAIIIPFLIFPLVLCFTVSETYSATIKYGTNFFRTTLDFSIVWEPYYKDRGYKDVDYFESQEGSIFDGMFLSYDTPWGAVPYGPDDNPEYLAAWYSALTGTDGGKFHFTSGSMRPDDSDPMPNKIFGGALSEIYMEFKILSDDVDIYAHGITITDLDTGIELTGGVSLLKDVSYKMEGSVFAPGDSDERYYMFLDNFYAGNKFVPEVVPEPAGIWLLLSNLIGIALFKEKKKPHSFWCHD